MPSIHNLLEERSENMGLLRTEGLVRCLLRIVSVEFCFAPKVLLTLPVRLLKK